MSELPIGPREDLTQAPEQSHPEPYKPEPVLKLFREFTANPEKNQRELQKQVRMGFGVALKLVGDDSTLEHFLSGVSDPEERKAIETTAKIVAATLSTNVASSQP